MSRRASAKLRLSWLALPASRSRSSSFAIVVSNSSTTSPRHMRHRRARDRRAIEGAEHFGARLAIGARERGLDFAPRERRHRVLQLRELLGDVVGNQVAAHREQLAELHEHRAERFERKAQPHAAPPRVPGPEVSDAKEQPRERPAATRQELVHAVTADGEDDAEQTQGVHGTAMLPASVSITTVISCTVRTLL